MDFYGSSPRADSRRGATERKGYRVAFFVCVFLWGGLRIRVSFYPARFCIWRKESSNLTASQWGATNFQPPNSPPECRKTLFFLFFCFVEFIKPGVCTR